MSEKLTPEIEQMLDDEMHHSELHVDDDPPADAKFTQPGREAAKVFTFRLEPSKVAELQELASESGVPASALVRGFVLEGLSARGTATVTGALDRLDADVRLLRQVASEAS